MSPQLQVMLPQYLFTAISLILVDKQFALRHLISSNAGLLAFNLIYFMERFSTNFLLEFSKFLIITESVFVSFLLTSSELSNLEEEENHTK